MKKTILTMILMLMPMLVDRTAGSENAIIAPGAKLEKLAGGFEFTEGPASDSRRKRLLHRSAQRPHPQMEHPGAHCQLSCSPAGDPTGYASIAETIFGPVPTNTTNFGASTRRARSSVVVKDIRKKLLNGPERRLDSAGRRTLLHRSVLPAALLET